jgi:hypothetical protein
VGLQLQAMRYQVCASPDYLARHGRPATPAELGHHDCLRFPLPGFATLWRFREGGAGPVEAVPVKGWLTLSTALALHQAARDGLGPVLLAEWLVAEDLAAGRLVDLFPQHEVTASHFDSAVWLLYPSREHLPLRVRVLIDFLKARLMRPDGTGVPAPARPPAGTGPVGQAVGAWSWQACTSLITWSSSWAQAAARRAGQPGRVSGRAARGTMRGAAARPASRPPPPATARRHRSAAAARAAAPAPPAGR